MPVDFFFHYLLLLIIIMRAAHDLPLFEAWVFVCLLGRVCLDPPARRERTETSEPWWDLNCCGVFSFAGVFNMFPTYQRTWSGGGGGGVHVPMVLKISSASLEFGNEGDSWRQKKRTDVNSNEVTFGISGFLSLSCSLAVVVMYADGSSRTSLIIN